MNNVENFGESGLRSSQCIDKKISNVKFPSMIPFMLPTLINVYLIFAIISHTIEITYHIIAIICHIFAIPRSMVPAVEHPVASVSNE